jgi:hypothetical protein
MIRSSLLTLGVVALLDTGACASHVDTPELAQATEPLACSCLTCGTESTPYMKDGPDGIAAYVDGRSANAWAFIVEPSGACRMGQYSQSLTIGGATIYSWVPKPNVACPSCVCRIRPGGELSNVGDAGQPCGSPSP